MKILPASLIAAAAAALTLTWAEGAFAYHGTGSAEPGAQNQMLLFAIPALLVLAGIVIAILRDARNSAPADVRAGADSDQAPAATRPSPTQRRKRNRAKGRAARAARKRNR